MVRIRRFAPYLAASAVVLGLLAYGVVSYRVADGITKLERKPLVPVADTVSKVHEDVSFRATDGLLRKGWWFPAAARAQKAVVFVHGRGQNRIASSFRPDKIAPIGIVLAGKLFFGLDVVSVKPAEVVRAHPERAWLFIQCTADPTVFAYHGTDLKAASANPNSERVAAARPRLPRPPDRASAVGPEPITFSLCHFCVTAT